MPHGQRPAHQLIRGQLTALCISWQNHIGWNWQTLCGDQPADFHFDKHNLLLKVIKEQ